MSKFFKNAAAGPQAGMSLVETVIAVAFVGVVTAAATNLAFMKKKSLAVAAKSGKIADLRANIRSTLSCKNTLAGADCTRGRTVAVPRKCDGTTLGTSTTPQVGDYNIQVTCGTEIGPNRLKVEYKPVASRDSSRNQEWKDLTGGIPLICDPAMPAAGPSQIENVADVNDPNAITDVYLIVDNSFSMAAIQAKTATAVSAMIDQLVALDANVDLYLYTTTLEPRPPISSVGSNLGTLDFNLGCWDPTFCNRTGDNSALRVKDIFYYNSTAREVETGNPININLNELIEQRYTTELAPSLFPGGKLEIRRNMKGRDADDVKAAASSAISSLGTNGGDTEQPLKVLDEIAKRYTGPSDHRFAAWIVTNEDDRSSTIGYQMASATTVEPPSRTMMGTAFAVNAYVSNLEYWTVPVMRDGIQVSPGYWTRVGGSGGAGIDCGVYPEACSSVTTSSATCSTTQHNIAVATWQSPNFRYHAPPTCTIIGHNATATISATNNSVTCDSRPGGWTETYRQVLRRLYSAFRWETDNCREVDQASLIRRSGTSFSIDAPAYVPSDTLTTLTQTFGPRGFKVAVIGNDGVSNCGQGTDLAVPTKLKSFLDQSPSSEDFLSICSASYAPIANKIKDFVDDTPQLVYNLRSSGGNVAKVYVQYKDTTTRVLIDPSKWSVTSRRLTIASGVAQVGDSIVIEYEEGTRTGNDAPHLASTCPK